MPRASSESYDTPRFGAHMSIAGGLLASIKRSVEAGCQCMAIFSASPRVWRRTMPDHQLAETFQATAKAKGLSPIILHALYLANLASPDRRIRQRSIHAMVSELEFAALLGIRWVVLHPGSHGGKGEAAGVSQCARSLEEVLRRTAKLPVGIALETTAGAGGFIGARLEHLRDIIDSCRLRDRLSICVDTCHIFVAGYDIRTAEAWENTAQLIDKVTGLSSLTVLHLNDSKADLGSHVDRHTHIGEGRIGLEGFKAIINDPRLHAVPMILETPKSDDGSMDKTNLERLRSLVYRDRPPRS